MEILTKIVACTLLAILGASLPPASAQALDEYSVKAAFLFNFTKFIEWPAQTASGLSPFIIGIMGDDPFGRTIDQLVSGKTVNGRELQVRRIKDAAEARNFQIVFIGRSEVRRTAQALVALQGTGVLTVGEAREFMDLGGMISLRAKDNRVGVMINPVVAEAAGFKISAKLLSLAEIRKD